MQKLYLLTIFPCSVLPKSCFIVHCFERALEMAETSAVRSWTPFSSNTLMVMILPLPRSDVHWQTTTDNSRSLSKAVKNDSIMEPVSIHNILIAGDKKRCLRYRGRCCLSVSALGERWLQWLQYASSIIVCQEPGRNFTRIPIRAWNDDWCPRIRWNRWEVGTGSLRCLCVRFVLEEYGHRWSVAARQVELFLRTGLIMLVTLV